MFQMHPDPAYRRSLEEFYRHLNDVFHFRPSAIPDVFIIPDKTAFNALIRRTSAEWEIGCAQDGAIYFLALDVIKATETHENYSVDDLGRAIRHEAAHVYFNQLTKKRDERKMPRWLSEGLATYWSGQQERRNLVKVFEHLNDQDPAAMKYHYGEGGTAVQRLIEVFGIEKLKVLLGRLVDEKDVSHFAERFADVYGFPPTDEEFNQRLRSN